MQVDESRIGKARQELLTLPCGRGRSMGPGKDNVYKVQAAAEKDSLGGQNSMAYAEG